MSRPPTSKKYPNIIPIYLEISKDHTIELSEVSKRGYPKIWLPGLAGQEITAIVGCFLINGGGKRVRIDKKLQVYTCLVGSKGDISSVGKENAGRELTVIYKIPEKQE